MISSRELALKVLFNIENNNAYVNIELNKQLNSSQLDVKDRSFATELVYGVIKWKINIDWIIGQCSNIKLKKISPWILNILRLGIYQIRFLDKIPVSASVNESVNLAKRYGNAGSVKFVNGLLRNYSRNTQSVKYPNPDNIVKYFSVMYSHPEWMIEKWIKNFGKEFTQDLLKANNEIPKVNIRVNTLKCSKQGLIDILTNEGVEIEQGLYFDECLIIKSTNSVTDLDSYKKGLFQIQDESSIMVGEILNPKSGQFVIDVCSAPGGKSTHIAQLMSNKGNIISRDIHQHKIELIRKNTGRLGISIILPEVYDGIKLDNNLIDKADCVLVDAPCSGLGIIRRKPDIKWNRDTEDTYSLINIQKQILNTSSKYVKQGGILVYSTCTIEKEENLGVINEFLNNNRNFKLIDISDRVPKKLLCNTLKRGFIQTYPNIHNIDGFFVAKMTKTMD